MGLPKGRHIIVLKISATPTNMAAQINIIWTVFFAPIRYAR